jgi:hypothetical protein
MSYVAKNYRESADKMVIGGVLEVTADGQVTKLGVPVVLGKLMPHLDPATATVADVINALITAGYMSAS